MAFWKLYRRSANPDDLTSQPEEFEVTAGVTGHIIMTESPGWYAFDFRAEVANEADGSLGVGEFQVLIDGEVHVSYQASWPWTRHYMFLPQKSTPYDLLYRSYGYKEGDKCFIRYQNKQYFRSLDYVKAIANVVPPKPLEEMIEINILAGYNRYQSTGPNGTSIEMSLNIKGTAGYRDFMKSLSNYYILSGNEGFYGGVILPQSVQTKKLGVDLYIIDCTLQSNSLAGEGHFG